MSSVPQDFEYDKMKSRKYKAEDFNVNCDLQHGPLKDRKCTDICCCMIFLLFLGTLSFMGVYGYINGEVSKLIAPVDANGRICGYSVGVEKYPSLYIANINYALAHPTSVNGIFKYSTCVEKCPTTTTSTVNCVNTKNINSNSATAVCPGTASGFEVYSTKNYFDYCIPQDDGSNPAQYALMEQTLSDSLIGGWAMDLYKSRYIILASVGICFVITLIYIKLMDWFAVYMAWISVILIQAGLIGTGIMCYVYRTDALAKNANADETALWWGMLCSFIVAGLYYICIICCFKQLRVSISIIETAADWFADTKRIIFVPMGYFFLGCLVFGAWATALVMVCSISENGVGTDPPGQLKTVVWSQQTYWFIYTLWFGIFWIITFIMACSEFVVIVATVTWYFSRKDIPDDDGIPGDSEVWMGYYWTIRYHFGSLAFGSCVLAIVWIIRGLFEYIAEKMEDSVGNNGCTKCLICCCRCCLDCFDRFIRHLTLNAYIYMALSNESFCSSAINAFLLTLKNSVKFAMVDGMAHIFMFIGKCCITSSTTFLGFLLIKPMTPTGVTITDPFIPVFIIALFSYTVSSVFIGIFDASANTILQCYLMDMDMCKQRGEIESKHIPPTLAKFFKSYNLHSCDEDMPEGQSLLNNKASVNNGNNNQMS